MEKVLIVSGDGDLIDKLRFIFFENYGASDITTISNPDSCISIASKINPELIVVDTSAFLGSMQEFFLEKNSQTLTRQIPIVFFDKGSKLTDLPQLSAVINASISEQDIKRSLSIIKNIKRQFDNYSRHEDASWTSNSQAINDYLLDSHAYMLNEIEKDPNSGRYQYNIVETSPKFEKIMGIDSNSSHSLQDLHGIENDNTLFYEKLNQKRQVIRTQQFYNTNQKYLDIISFGISDTKIATFVKDITPQMNLEHEIDVVRQQADCYEKFKNTFISNISHEIRTPMNAIIGFSRLLESETIEPKKRKQYVSIIQKSGFQLIETLEKLIDLSKIQTNQMVLFKRQIDLNVVITELDVFAQRKLFENGKDEILTFNINCREAIPSIPLISDQSRLIQVLKELVDNAIKFTPEGSVEFGFKLKEMPDDVYKLWYEFYVKDTGFGLDDKCLNDILKLYNKIDNTEFSKSGLGLGISISQKLVELLGGTFKAESIIGEGSIFYVSIPIS